MLEEAAWKIVHECRGWNTSQKSPSAAFGGPRTAEDDVLDAKRSALAEAWAVIRDGVTRRAQSTSEGEPNA